MCVCVCVCMYVCVYGYTTHTHTHTHTTDITGTDDNDISVANIGTPSSHHSQPAKTDGGRGDECGAGACHGATWGRATWGDDTGEHDTGGRDPWVRDTRHESPKMGQSKSDAWCDNAFQSLGSDPVQWQEQQVFFFLIDFYRRGLKRFVPPCPVL